MTMTTYEDIVREACGRWTDPQQRSKDILSGATAYHEAGHAVAFYVLLFPPEWIWVGHDGGSVSPGWRVAMAGLHHPPHWWVNRRLVASLAGRVTDALVTGGPIDYYGGPRGGDRAGEARDLDSIAPGFSRTREGRRYRDRLRKATKAFVRSWWPEIDALARTLWSRAVADEDFITGMSGDEAAAIVGAVRGRKSAPMPADAPESLHWPSDAEIIQQAMQAHEQQAAASN